MKFHGLTIKRAAACVALLLGFVQALPAAAAEDTQQVLDRVYTYTAGSVLNMAFGNASRPPDFTKLGVSASGISACTLTSVDGLFCLDGQNLKRVGQSAGAQSGKHHTAQLHRSRAGVRHRPVAVCTGMTVDESGAIWLSGKKRLPNNWPPRPWWIPEQTWIALQTWFKPYSLVKVTKNLGSCPGGASKTLAGGAYCAAEKYSGRYLVTQLSPAEVGGNPGVVGVEDFRNLLFFAEGGTEPVTLSGGWNSGLKFGEVFDDVTVLKHAGQSFVVATTNSGRVLAKNATSNGALFQVFNIATDRAPGLAKCSNSQGKFGVRASPTASIIFVTDRAYCQAMALVPNSSGTGFTGFVHLKWNDLGVVKDLTLKTKDATGTFPVIGLTVAPGIGFDFANCEVGETCTMVNGPDGNPAAKLSNVQVVQGSTAATVFQVKDLPDCRYAFKDGFTQRALCASRAGVVVNPYSEVPVTVYPDGTNNSGLPPSALVLNVTPLLPSDVTDLFDGSGAPPNGLPRLLVSRQYRAQSRNNFLFDAIFVKPAAGVQFAGVFSAEYDVPALEGGLPNSSLGCVPVIDPPTRNPSVPLGVPPALADLLKWDVTTAVSETWISVNNTFIDSMSNTGCGSVKGDYSRLSLLPYNMEISPDTYWRTRASSTASLTTGNDAVFIRLADSLVDDLKDAYYGLACTNVDNPGGQPPLSDYYCNPANSTPPQHFGTYPIDHLWWIREKLDRCMRGAFDSIAHDNMAFDPNRPYCLSYLERLDLFQASLPATTPLHDKANRVGELKARVNVLRNLHRSRVLPSIPDGGFTSEPAPVVIY